MVCGVWWWACFQSTGLLWGKTRMLMKCSVQLLNIYQTSQSSQIYVTLILTDSPSSHLMLQTNQSQHQQLMLLNSNILAWQQKPSAPLSPKILQHLLPFSFTYTKKTHTGFSHLNWKTNRKTKVAKRVEHLVPKARNSKCPNQIWCARGSQRLWSWDRCSQGLKYWFQMRIKQHELDSRLFLS